jgi:hypothetical protein
MRGVTVILLIMEPMCDRAIKTRITNKATFIPHEGQSGSVHTHVHTPRAIVVDSVIVVIEADEIMRGKRSRGNGLCRTIQVQRGCIIA